MDVSLKVTPNLTLLDIFAGSSHKSVPGFSVQNNLLTEPERGCI